MDCIRGFEVVRHARAAPCSVLEKAREKEAEEEYAPNGECLRPGSIRSRVPTEWEWEWVR